MIAERSELTRSLPVRGGWEGRAFNSLFARSIIRGAVSLLRESETAGKAGDYIKLSTRDLNQKGFTTETQRHREGLAIPRFSSVSLCLCGSNKFFDQSSRASFDLASGGFLAK